MLAARFIRTWFITLVPAYPPTKFGGNIFRGATLIGRGQGFLRSQVKYLSLIYNAVFVEPFPYCVSGVNGGGNCSRPMASLPLLLAPRRKNDISNKYLDVSKEVQAASEFGGCPYIATKCCSSLHSQGHCS